MKLQPSNSYSNISLRSLISWNIDRIPKSKLLMLIMKESEKLKKNLDQGNQAMYRHLRWIQIDLKKEIQQAMMRINPAKQQKIKITQPKKLKTKTRDHSVKK